MVRHRRRNVGGPVPDLGTCCVCGGVDGVRNLIMLSERCPIPGRGWACFTCDLPPDGATAVVCDGCMSGTAVDQAAVKLKWACRGYPGTDGRVPVTELTGQHRHDLSRHPEAAPGDPG